VHNVEEVSKVNPATQAVRIGHTVGKMKRALIIAGARKMSLVILNVKEVKEPAKEEAAPKEAENKQKEPEKKAKKEEKPKKTKKKTTEGKKKQ
jgi:outer membrane biosynthesis protein TonB